MPLKAAKDVVVKRGFNTEDLRLKDLNLCIINMVVQNLKGDILEKTILHGRVFWLQK